MTGRRNPTAPRSVLWGLIAAFAGVMVVVCLAGWDVVAAAYWTLALLISVVAWLRTRAHARRE